MSGSAPPSVWLHNNYNTTATQASPRRQETSADTVTAVEAWKQVSRIAGTTHRHDLFDLLHNSPSDSQYSFPQSGWPASMRPLAQLQELPAQVIEKHNNVQTVCFCGVFPELRRAWASVDNILFLWRLDRWNDVPTVYGEEQQAICLVQIVTPVTGVFAAAIRHLLVICTTTEVVLLGVATSAGPSGQGDPLQELTLQPLPEYSVPSDNVIMACAAGTASGRIFLGGGDGRLYEIKYGGAGVRCRKVCHTSGLWDYLPSFLQRASSPIVELLPDDARGLLYARTAASEVVVFDLGADGQSGPHRRADCTDLTKAAAYCSGREVFSGRNPADFKGAAIVQLAVIPPSESLRLHLLVVTADGRRVYFSVYPHQYTTQPPQQRRQPTQLQAEIARRALPQPGPTSQGRAGLTPQPASRGLEVAAACYHRGALLVAEGSAADGAVAGRTRLLTAARDLTQPPLGTAIGAAGGAVGVLRESVSELAIAIPGEACAIRKLDSESPLGGAADFSFQDDLRTQLYLPAPRYVLVSTSGTLLLERRRPVDTLWAVLEERTPSRLASFFALYTPAEAACMCYQLAAAPLDAVPAAVRQAAASTLQDPQLAGVPETSYDSPSQDEQQAPRQKPGGFDMGAAVPVADPQWSGSLQGLALYLQRLLSPVGDRVLVMPQDPSNPDGLLLGCLQVAALQELEERLRLLSALLGDMLSKARARAESGRSWAGMFDSRAVAAMNGGSAFGRTGVSPSKRPRLVDGAKQELQVTGAIAGLTQRTAEAAFLVRLLSSHHLGRLAARLQPEARQVLKRMTLRELAAGAEGEALAAQLISVLITDHLASPGSVSDELAAQLQGGAPAFFKADDRTFYKAAGLLRQAEGAANGAQAHQLAQQALTLMSRAPAAVDMSVVVPQLALLGSWEGVVSLPIQKAAAIDPEGQAGEHGEVGRAARQARLDCCYAPVAAVILYLIDPSDKTALAGVHRDLGLDAAQRSAALKSLLQAAGDSSDPYFIEVVYGSLIDVGATQQLLAMDGRSSRLESFLRTTSGTATTNGSQLPALQPDQVKAAHLLSQLYVKRGQYDAAAAVQEALAMRASGDTATAAVSLEERLQCITDAVLQARSNGAGGLIDRLSGRQQVLELQKRTAEALEDVAQQSQSQDAGSRGSDAAESAHELREVPVELAALYNDFAARFQLWGLCLEMVNVAAYSDPSYVKQLWDVHLKAAIDRALEHQPGASSGRDCSSSADVALEAAAAEVGSLGSRLFPSTASFPGTHLIMRLEQTACGQWPYRASPCSSDRASDAIIKATGSAAEAVRLYGRALEVAGGSTEGSILHAPLLRMSLLRSAAQALRVAQADNKEHKAVAYGAYGGAASASREAADLAEIAEMFLTESRRLPTSDNADDLAETLSNLHNALSNQAARFD